MARDSLDLLRGTLDLLVLQTLSGGVLHGYDVARSIRERTGDEILVLEGALYPALHRLERRGLVASTWGHSDKHRKAKYYRLTARGRQQLSADVAQWRRYTRAVARVRLLVVPGLVVHGVHAVDLHAPAVDVVGERGDHPLALVLVLVSPAGGEHDQRRPVVAVDLDPHLAAEPARVPVVVFALHPMTSGTRILLPDRGLRKRKPP